SRVERSSDHESRTCHAVHWIARWICSWSGGRVIVCPAGETGESLFVRRGCSVWFQWAVGRAAFSRGRGRAFVATETAAVAHPVYPVHGQAGRPRSIFSAYHFVARLCALTLFDRLRQWFLRTQKRRCARRVFQLTAPGHDARVRGR